MAMTSAMMTLPIRIMLLACAAPILAGCATAPMREMQANLAYERSRNIKPPTPKQDLLAFFRSYFNDPTGVRDGSWSEPAIAAAQPVERYVSCVRYNAKKTAGGGYAGPRTGAAIFISGRIDHLVELDRQPGQAEESSGNKALREFCAAANYQPFPELSQLTR
jgi:hypothetical protein